jgi:hypothetical protein
MLCRTFMQDAYSTLIEEYESKVCWAWWNTCIDYVTVQYSYWLSYGGQGGLEHGCAWSQWLASGAPGSKCTTSLS